VFCRREFYKYDATTGTWSVLTDAHVRRIVLEYAGAAVYAGMGEGGKPSTRTMKMNEGRVKGTVSLAGTRLYVDDDFFDHVTPGLAFKNGYAVVEGGEVKLLEHSPKHRARYHVDFAYREDAPCERWMRFLDEIFLGDEDRAQKIAALQEFFGLCLTSRVTEYDGAFILFGPGASNGKSVFVATIERLFPRDVRRSIPPQKWDHEYYKAQLDGAMLNCVGELPQREILDSEAFKDTISGDSVTGRHPSGRPFNFKPKCGHFFAANRLPTTGDVSPGFFRRWRLITLNRSFQADPAREEKDVLKAKLAAEVPGITAWALQGAARMSGRADYTAIPSSVAAIERWQISNDPIQLFVREMCEPLDSDSTVGWERASKLYEEYRRWCEKSGRKGIHNETTFGERLTTLGYGAKRHSIGMIRPLRICVGGADVDLPPDPGGPQDDEDPFSPTTDDMFGGA
jgi:P4 family phage/plasmid primase-like protien